MIKIAFCDDDPSVLGNLSALLDRYCACRSAPQVQQKLSPEGEFFVSSLDGVKTVDYNINCTNAP